MGMNFKVFSGPAAVCTGPTTRECPELTRLASFGELEGVDLFVSYLETGGRHQVRTAPPLQPRDLILNDEDHPDVFCVVDTVRELEWFEKEFTKELEELKKHYKNVAVRFVVMSEVS